MWILHLIGIFPMPTLWGQHPCGLRSINRRTETCCSRVSPKKSFRKSPWTCTSRHPSLHSPDIGTFCWGQPANGHNVAFHANLPRCIVTTKHLSEHIPDALFSLPHFEDIVIVLSALTNSHNDAKPSHWPTATPRPYFSPSCKTGLFGMAYQSLSQLVVFPSLYQRLSSNCATF